jgi:hypothetical protein
MIMETCAVARRFAQDLEQDIEFVRERAISGKSEIVQARPVS